MRRKNVLIEIVAKKFLCTITFLVIIVSQGMAKQKEKAFQWMGEYNYFLLDIDTNLFLKAKELPGWRHVAIMHNLSVKHTFDSNDYYGKGNEKTPLLESSLINKHIGIGEHRYSYINENTDKRQISDETTCNMTTHLSIGINLLYLAALAPNVTAEYYFPSSHWSILATFTMPWWQRRSKHQFYQIRQYLIEGRYWLNEAGSVKGHFFGYNVHGGIYDLENKKTGYYGEFIGTSFTYGYMLRLNKKMALECTIGGGYIFTNYEKYLPLDNCYVYQSTHNTHYWGITKAGISLVWNILY